nr:hypothetical protein [Bacillus sp. AFS017336]
MKTIGEAKKRENPNALNPIPFQPPITMPRKIITTPIIEITNGTINRKCSLFLNRKVETKIRIQLKISVSSK